MKEKKEQTIFRFPIQTKAHEVEIEKLKNSKKVKKTTDQLKIVVVRGIGRSQDRGQDQEVDRGVRRKRLIVDKNTTTEDTTAMTTTIEEIEVETAEIVEETVENQRFLFHRTISQW